MTVSILALIAPETFATIYDLGLEVADTFGLPVTSWRTGDPTLSLFTFLARQLAAREDVTSEFIKSGFLSLASGDWLTVLASEVHGVDREEATYATSTITLANGGGGYYPRDVGDVTVRNSTTGKTYHTTASFTLASGPGTTATVAVVADEEGSDSSAALDEIDEIVTTMLGVTITASTVAVGIDEQSDASLKDQCYASRGALSSNGPPDAYMYVAKNSDLTGVTDITRAQSTFDSSLGEVTVYVAGAAGAVAGASVTAAQAAEEVWATPLCITPTVVNATEQAIAVTATITGDDIPATIDTDVEAAFAAALSALAISTADAPTVVSLSSIISLIHSTAVAGGASNVSVSVSVPAANTTLTNGKVATAGAVTVTEV
jgi:hypothetical protein